MVEFGQMDTRIQLMNCHSSSEVTCHECLAAYHSAFQGGSAGIQLENRSSLVPLLGCCTSAQNIEHHQLKSPPDSRTPSSWLEVLRLLRAFLSLGKVPNGLLERRHTRMTLLGLDYRVNGVLPSTHSSTLRSLSTWRRTATPPGGINVNADINCTKSSRSKCKSIHF